MNTNGKNRVQGTNYEDQTSKHYEQFTQNRREQIEKQRTAIKKRRRKHFFLMVIFLFLLSFAICFGADFMLSAYNEVPDVTPTTTVVANKETVDGLSNAEKQLVKDTVNILLVGEDNPLDAERGRTDSIIIATVDPVLKKVKLTSLMRDMYVDIPGYKSNKINSAYSIGGIDLLQKTIKRNFNFDLGHYVIINYDAFVSVIDAIGGIEVEIKDYELKELNKCIADTSQITGKPVPAIGLQRLDGRQALAYCRIRHVGNSDYERTERQRRVLSLIIQKAKTLNVTQYPKLLNAILPHIKTNISKLSIMQLAYTVYQFDNIDPETLRIPIDHSFDDTEINGASVLVPNLRKNSAALFNFVYETAVQRFDSTLNEDDTPINTNTKSQTIKTPTSTTKTPSTTSKTTTKGSTTTTGTKTTTSKTGTSPTIRHYP